MLVFLTLCVMVIGLGSSLTFCVAVSNLQKVNRVMDSFERIVNILIDEKIRGLNPALKETLGEELSKLRRIQ